MVTDSLRYWGPNYPQTFMLFSKAQCKQWRDDGSPNTPLADYLDVDFEVIEVNYDLAEPWYRRYHDGELSKDELEFAMASYNGVYIQVQIIVRKIARA